MPSLRTLLRDKPILCLWLAAFVAFAMWFYVDRIWAPQVELNFSDLYPRWYGARELLLHRRNPYSLEVTHEIQYWGHGRALTAAQEGSTDEDRFAYPLYIVFVLAPTVRFSFATVTIIFRFLFPLIALLTAVLWLVALQWRCKAQVAGALALLMFGSFPALQCIYLQQPALLASAFLAAGYAALATGRLGLAGVLLAISTIKPQLSGLGVLWPVFWALSDWRARRRLFVGFAVTMLALTAVSEWMVPGWMREFLTGLLAYQHYTRNTSLLSLLLGQRGALVASALFVIALTVLAWKFRRDSQLSENFALVSCLTLSVTAVVVPTMYPSTQLVLIPAILWLLAHRAEMVHGTKATRLSWLAAVYMAAWPWVAAVGSMVAVIVFGLSAVRRFWIIPVSTVPATPITITLALAVYAMTQIRTNGSRRAVSQIETGSYARRGTPA